MSRRAGKQSFSFGAAFVAAALAAAQSTPSQSLPDAIDLLRNVEATYTAMGAYSAKSTRIIEMNDPNMQNRIETTETISVDSSGKFRTEKHGPSGHGNGL